MHKQKQADMLSACFVLMNTRGSFAMCFLSKIDIFCFAVLKMVYSNPYDFRLDKADTERTGSQFQPLDS